MTTTLLVVAQNEIEGMRAIMPRVRPDWCRQVFYELGLDLDSTYARYERVFFTRLGVEPILSARSAKRRLRTADIACPRAAANRRHPQAADRAMGTGVHGAGYL